MSAWQSTSSIVAIVGLLPDCRAGVRVEIQSELAEITHLKFSDDGKFLCAIQNDIKSETNTVVVWELANQKKLASLQSSDGSFLRFGNANVVFAAGGKS